jgi:hypothetical protein
MSTTLNFYENACHVKPFRRTVLLFALWEALQRRCSMSFSEERGILWRCG